MNEEKRENHENLEEAVRLRRRRRALGQHEGERPLGRNLALIGALSWTIVTPTLIGVFVGRLASGIFWTLSLLAIGLALGCALSWKRMQSE